MQTELTPLLINIALMVVSMIWVNWDFLKNSKEFWESIKGKDKVLQAAEGCIYVWIRILPIVVLSDLFLEKTISTQAWYSLDAVFFALIAGDLGHKYLDNKKQD
jgi:hypothetical protein